jgi:hypothetical protein
MALGTHAQAAIVSPSCLPVAATVRAPPPRASPARSPSARLPAHSAAGGGSTPPRTPHPRPTDHAGTPKKRWRPLVGLTSPAADLLQPLA